MSYIYIKADGDSLIRKAENKLEEFKDEFVEMGFNEEHSYTTARLTYDLIKDKVRIDYTFVAAKCDYDKLSKRPDVEKRAEYIQVPRIYKEYGDTYEIRVVANFCSFTS